MNLNKFITSCISFKKKAVSCMLIIVSLLLLISTETANGQGSTLTVAGPSPVFQGTSSSYTATAISGATYTWNLPAAAGTISGSGGTVTVQWSPTYSGTALLKCTAQDADFNVYAGSKSVQVNAATSVTPGAVSPAIQSVSSTAIPATLIGTTPTGGNGVYSYQWQNSTDNITFLNIGGATSASYTPGVLTNTTYYRRAVTSSSGQTVYSNAVTILVSNCAQLNSSPSLANNYIVSSSFRTAGITSVTDAQIAGLSMCEVMQTVQYFDGLGRTLQTVQVKSSPLGYDVVEPVAYDAFSREVKKYLSYTPQTGTVGSYRPNAVGADQSAFYTTPPPGSGVSAIASAFSQTVFEPSPLNRVTEQGAPGTDWQPVPNSTAGHTLKIGYHLNNTQPLNGTGADTAHSTLAALYAVTINADQSRTLTRASGTAGTYAVGALSVMVSKDENWISGRGGTTEEYKDKDGRIVLKRTFNYNTSIPGNPVLEILSTYYVYDDLGNLAFVLPPMAQADGGLPLQTTLDNLCYQYRYDERNRLTQKKLPGKGWEYTVYNQLDQPVLTQDANQRTTNQWTVTKYDNQGRVIITGLWTAGVISLATLQANIYAGAQWDVRSSAAATGFTITSYPATLNKILSISYYDDYTNIPGLPAFPQTGFSTMTKGLLTATKITVLNTLANATPDMLWTAHYYDDLGRVVKSYQQHYLGGMLSPYNYDAINTTYDFTNVPTTVTRAHYTKNAGNTAAVLAVTIANTYDYDHTGRKINTWEQINSGANTLLSNLRYNEIGQLMTKNLHGDNTAGMSTSADITLGLADAMTSGTKTVTATNSITLQAGFSVASGATFTAHISGYLQSISYTYNERGWLLSSIAPLFSQTLQYNSGTHPQYNGNIANQYWGTAGSLTNNYGYTYDQLNRLTKVTASTGNNEVIGYDLMGNITSLSRAGMQPVNLAYTYENGNQSNHLASVTNNGAAFRNYGYDVNGNAVSDGAVTNTKGIQYNLFNLPQTVTQGAATLATYTYDATGTKLRNIGTDGSWDYINGIVYNNNAIAFIQTEEGRVVPQSGNWNYEYNLTDNLGNVRVSFDKDPTTGTARGIQQDDYYAFGLRIPIYNFSNNNRYLYNGKEVQTDLTNQYDYGARFYDPVIGRWTSVDPNVENGQESITSYGYVFDDPVKNKDPDGREPNDDPPTALSMTGNFVKGLGQSAWGTVTGTYNAIRHPINTAQGLLSFNTPIGAAMASLAVSNTIDKFQNGNGDVKANMIGQLTGDVGQMFIGAGEVKAGMNAIRGAKIAEETSVVAKVADVADATGFGPKADPIRIQGPWTKEDLARAANGQGPLDFVPTTNKAGKGMPLELHHGDQMPGSAIHEVHPSHAGKVPHPNKFNQGVTPSMRQQDSQLHWYMRGLEMGNK